MSNLTTRQRLELFVSRSEELQKLRLIRQGIRAKFNFSWNAIDGKLVYTSNEPDEEDFRSFLLLFRQFISDDEPIFINKMFNDCELSLVDEKIKEELRQVRAEWNRIFRKMSDFEINIDGKLLNSEYVLDLWINGYYFHNDVDKAAKLAELTKGWIPLTRMQLFAAIPGLTRIIIEAEQIIVKCLKEGNFTFRDENTSLR